MDPPINENSKAAHITLIPLIFPSKITRASFSFVTFCADEILSLYFLLSLNFKKSFEDSFENNSFLSSTSRNNSNLSLALILM